MTLAHQTEESGRPHRSLRLSSKSEMSICFLPG